LGWLQDARDLDAAIYAAIARAKTPTIDEAMRRLSRTADYSRLWLALAGGLATIGGPSGRRAAARGLESVAVAATLANVVAKPLSARRRPDRRSHRVPALRQVRMPRSSSFPSGHSASAFAFATAVAHVLPPLAGPMRALAALVAYSRVHIGVHYVGDVLAGAVLGVCSAKLTERLIEAQAARAVITRT
jgi:membrane-associated phospholipid phosphatase